MKTVDIITSEMHLVHGANRVTEKLIMGRQLFEKQGIKLRYLISQDGIINCDEYITSALGTLSSTPSYIRRRSLINSLKSLPFYKSYFVQKKILDNSINKNKVVLDFMNGIEPKPDLIIYQDPFTASVCLSSELRKIPSILISHAADDPLEQLFMSRPSIKGRKEEKYLRDLFDRVFHGVERVVTICRGSQQFMLENYNLKCPCIINGIEDQVVTKKEESRDGRVNICIVASVQHRKGQDIASLMQKKQKSFNVYPPKYSRGKGLCPFGSNP